MSGASPNGIDFPLPDGGAAVYNASGFEYFRHAGALGRVPRWGPGRAPSLPRLNRLLFGVTFVGFALLCLFLSWQIATGASQPR